MDNPTLSHPKGLTENLLDEGVLAITAAATAEGIEISTKTALRWCLRGVRGTRLESLKIRGRRLTSRAALRRFAMPPTKCSAATALAGRRHSEQLLVASVSQVTMPRMPEA